MERKKPLKVDDKNSKVVTARIPEEYYRILKTRVRDEQISMSNLIAYYIEKELHRGSKDATVQ